MSANASTSRIGAADSFGVVPDPSCSTGAPLGEGKRLRTMFVATQMATGGQESLAAELIRRLNRARFAPELCCLKRLGPLGEALAAEIPAFSQLLANRFDARVHMRLARLMRRRGIDAVVTVGTGGDRMFWGRLAAWQAGVPVVVSALHSSGTTRIEWLNRLLDPCTDAFVAVDETHRRYVTEVERCPAHKVRVIANGIDTERFRPLPRALAVRAELGISESAPVAGIVARIRPEKNHERFLRMADRVRRIVPAARFVIVGHGADRPRLEALAGQMGLHGIAHFCGFCPDVTQMFAAMDVFVLTSDLETSPVAILEAMATGKPVVSTRVASIAEMIVEGETGYSVDPVDEAALAERVAELLSAPQRAAEMGRAARQRVVAHYSVDKMVARYERLLLDLYACKRADSGVGPSSALGWRGSDGAV